jgi:UDP-2,3-diacylglucosamine hydrolase
MHGHGSPLLGFGAVALPVYFLSDAHLGGESPPREGPKERSLIAFLDARVPGETVYLLGDIFDFWFDDGRPPGSRHAAVLSALGRATDRGVRLLFMGGNHDYWVRRGRGPGWLERVIGIEVLEDPHVAVHHDRRLFLSHGDALGGAHGKYRYVRWVLRNPVTIAAFGILPRRLQYRLAGLTSAMSRKRHGEELLELASTHLREAAARILSRGEVDIVVAGHIHRPELLRLERGIYLNLGDWMYYRSYGVLRDGEIAIETFRPESTQLDPAVTTST